MLIFGERAPASQPPREVVDRARDGADEAVVRERDVLENDGVADGEARRRGLDGVDACAWRRARSGVTREFGDAASPPLRMTLRMFASSVLP